MSRKSIGIVVTEPCAISQVDLDSFQQLVEKGGEVTAYGLRCRIRRAFRVAWALSQEEMIGVAAIKRPDENYHHSVFRKSRTDESASSWPAELGWIFIEENYRGQGIASKLVSRLLDADPKLGVFATTRENNDPILPIMEKFGFEKTGEPYDSDEGDYKLVLRVRRAQQGAAVGRGYAAPLSASVKRH